MRCINRRNVFSADKQIDLTRLNLLVMYIKKQLEHMEHTDSRDLLNAQLKFLE
jgi:hypothetical protein